MSQTQPEWATTAITETSYVRLLTNRHVVGYDIATAEALTALRTLRGMSKHTFIVDDTTLAEPESISTGWWGQRRSRTFTC